MASKVTRDAPPNRRGAPEAVAKRRAGRAFNDLYEASSGNRLDGRTEKRRKRLLQELEHGRRRGSRRELKPLEIIAHVDELLALGESLATIRKVCKPHAAPRTNETQLVESLRELHAAYGFRPEAYRFVGVSDELLRTAGILDRDAPRRTRRPSIPPPASAGRR